MSPGAAIPVGLVAQVELTAEVCMDRYGVASLAAGSHEMEGLREGVGNVGLLFGAFAVVNLAR